MDHLTAEGMCLLCISVRTPAAIYIHVEIYSFGISWILMMYLSVAPHLSKPLNHFMHGFIHNSGFSVSLNYP